MLLHLLQYQSQVQDVNLNIAEVTEQIPFVRPITGHEGCANRVPG